MIVTLLCSCAKTLSFPCGRRESTRAAPARVTKSSGMDASLLKQVPLFAGLTSGQLQKLAGIAEQKTFSGSQYLFREGDPGEAMYVIASGKVRISKMVPGA